MIVGLILDFIFIALIILFVVYVILEKKKVDKEEYEFKTGMNKGYLIFSIVFIVIGVIFLGGSIALYFTNTPEGVWVCFGMGIFFAILADIVLYDNLLDYEAIDNKEIVIKRVFKKKTIYIGDIKSITISMMQGGSLVALDKTNKMLFRMALQTGNINLFIELLAKKSIELNNNMILRFAEYKAFTCDEYLKYIAKGQGSLLEENKEAILKNEEQKTNEEEVYIQIGEEYKKNIPQKLKKEKTKVIISFIVSFVVPILISYFFENSFFLILIPFILYSEIRAYVNVKKRLVEEEKLDVEELGRTHYFSNEKVVGYNKTKRKNMKVTSLVFMILGLVFAIPSFFSFFIEPIPQEDMIRVEGTISYIKLDEDDEDYIAIAINEEKEIEYRIYSIYIDEVDKTIFEKDGSNSQIILYIENEKPINNKSEFDENKTQWVDAYMVNIEGKDYLSYEGYQKGFIDDNNFVKVFFVLGATIAIVSFVVLVVSNKYYKNKEKEESIDAYK